MSTQYRDDSDLYLLAQADSDLLAGLVNILIKDNDKLRRTENLTSNPEFKQAQKEGNYNSVWKLIAAELQHYGGDTVVNLFRKTGVLYKEIVEDVCDVLKIKTENKEVKELEQEVIVYFFKKTWDSLSDNEKDDLLEEFNLNKELKNATIEDLTSEFGPMNLPLIVVNFVSASIKHSVIIKVGSNFALERIANPFGFLLGGIITAIPSITGAAYRVTIPSIIFIGAMRQKLQGENY